MPLFNKIQNAPALTALLGFLVAVCLLFPGFMSNDSFAQLAQARSNAFTIAHPPLLALIWQQVDRIIPGPLGMLLLQQALLWLGVFLLFQRRCQTGKVYHCGAMLLCLLFPPVVGILGAIWKDILMAAFLLLGFGAVNAYTCFFATTQNKRIARPLIICVAVFLLAAATRHNAFGAVFAGLWFLFFEILAHTNRLTIRLMRSFGCALLTTSGVLVLSTITASAITADNNKIVPLWQALAVFDIVGIAHHSKEFSSAEANKLKESAVIFQNKTLALDELNETYRPSSLSRLYHHTSGGPFQLNKLSTDQQKILGDLWRSQIFSTPQFYLAHRWSVFRELLTSSHAMVYLHSRPQDKVAMPAYASIRRPKYQAIFNRVLNRLSKSFLFEPWLYLGISLLCVLFGRFLLERGLAVCFFLPLSGLLYQASFFFLAGSRDYRYSHWMILACWAAVLQLWLYCMDRFRGRNTSIA